MYGIVPVGLDAMVARVIAALRARGLKGKVTHRYYLPLGNNALSSSQGISVQQARTSALCQVLRNKVPSIGYHIRDRLVAL